MEFPECQPPCSKKIRTDSMKKAVPPCKNSREKQLNKNIIIGEGLLLLPAADFTNENSAI